MSIPTAAAEGSALLAGSSSPAPAKGEGRRRRGGGGIGGAGNDDSARGGRSDFAVTINSPDDPSTTSDVADRGAWNHKVWLLRFFTAVSVAAALASGLLLVSQIASVFVVSSRQSLGPVQIVLRAYVVTFCLGFLMSELQVEAFLRRAESYNSWFHRGFMYTWVGVLGMEEAVAALGQAYPDHPAPPDLVVSVLLRASSLAMVGLGVVYMLMGALCLRPVWENLRQQQLLGRQAAAAAAAVLA